MKSDALLLLVGSYLLGSIPFGLIIGKLWGSVDVRQHGSGNIGTSNVMRTVGRKAAVIVLLLDVVKGFLPVWLAHTLGYSPTIVALAAVLSVAGHIWSGWLKFQGGKGIATAWGVAMALDGRIALFLIVVWIVVVLATRYISVASIAAAVTFPVFAWVYGLSTSEIIATGMISVFAIIRHRSNVARLMKGQEYRFGERAAPSTGRQ